MKYGYARVSTDDQKADMQRAALTKAGCTKIFTDEGLSGATSNRPALRRCLKALYRGDSLTVRKLDRLGRSLRDLIAILDDLKEGGVTFRSLTEAIDTHTPTGRAMWQMIGIMAEFERSLVSERTRAGVQDAKARGVKFGRKPALTPEQIKHANELRSRKRDPKTPPANRPHPQMQPRHRLPGACLLMNLTGRRRLAQKMTRPHVNHNCKGHCLYGITLYKRLSFMSECWK